MIQFIIFGYLALFNLNQEISNENIYFEELKANVSLNSDEYLIIMFTSLNECINCQEMLFKSLDCVSNKLKIVKIIGLIRANREKEIRKMKDRITWNFFLSFDDGTLKAKLKLDENIQIAVFKSDGKCLLKLDKNELKTIPLCNNLVDEILKDFKKLNK